MLTLDNPVTIPRKEYSFALALGLWLDYECFCSFVVELVFKALRISWQYPRLWKEIKLIGQHLLHIRQITS
jgi:hypothetical protein